MEITMGSLFDGIAGWQLAAVRNGVKPVWSSEIDPFPASISKKHFPDTIQLGDVTKIVDPPPVDIICAGSPCQDLSIAGQRQGLKGERSGLFRTAIRLIHRMRAKTNGEYPKIFIWENVTGSFSSNHGHDFQTVLAEITESEIPMPGSGRWAKAGVVRTPKADVAWRTLNTEFWGVPQHRERIFLITDFTRSGRATVLFESEGLPGSFKKSEKTRKEAERAVAERPAPAVIRERHGKPGGQRNTPLRAMLDSGNDE